MVVNYIYDVNPLYVYLKKHYCPKCKNKLKTKFICERLYSKDTNVDRGNFISCGNRFLGDAENKIGVFYCSNCNFKISFKDMKNYEKGQK